MVPVKDSEGSLLYLSELSYVKDTELISASMSAEQIVQAIKNIGLIPKAVIPTLLDSKGSAYIENMGYVLSGAEGWAWLDAKPENGGKRWNDPFLSGTKKYCQDLASELIKAGFEEVILSELRYPNFTDYDKTLLDSRIFAPDRYKALSELYSSIFSVSNKKAAVSINVKDLLDGFGKTYQKTSEILSDKSFSGKLYLTLYLSDFEKELKISEETTITLPADPVKKCEILIKKAAEYIKTNVTIVPVIRSEGLSGETLINCYKNLSAQ